MSHANIYEALWCGGNGKHIQGKKWRRMQEAAHQGQWLQYTTHTSTIIPLNVLYPSLLKEAYRPIVQQTQDLRLSSLLHAPGSRTLRSTKIKAQHWTESWATSIYQSYSQQISNLVFLPLGFQGRFLHQNSIWFCLANPNYMPKRTRYLLSRFWHFLATSTRQDIGQFVCLG